MNTKSRLQQEIEVVKILQKEFPEIRHYDPDRLVMIAGEISEAFYDG